MDLVLSVIEDHPAPPDEDALARDIAMILREVRSERGRVAALTALLGPDVRPSSIRAALRLTDDSSDQPNARLKVNGIDLYGDQDVVAIARGQAKRELYFRASYLAAVAGRVEKRRNDGLTINDAASAERGFYIAHGRARNRRLDSAAKAARASSQFGPMLGWYRSPESNSERECLVADGCNFYAAKPPVIGYPGSVHPFCACVSGPPHPGAQMVDDALADVIRLVPRQVPRTITPKLGRVRRVG